MLGALTVVVGGLLPWVDAAYIPSSAGQELDTELAIEVGAGLVGILLGVGLLLDGAATPLAIAALVAATVSGLSTLLVSNDLASQLAIRLGPGPYLAAAGVVFWTTATLNVLILATRPAPKRAAGSTDRTTTP